MNLQDASYLDFINSIVDINRRYSLLEYKEILVLRVILTNFANGTLVFVNEVTLMSEIGSQVTVHAVIKRLLKKRMIKSKVWPEDARRKYLLPETPALSWLSECTAKFIQARG